MRDSGPSCRNDKNVASLVLISAGHHPTTLRSRGQWLA